MEYFKKKTAQNLMLVYGRLLTQNSPFRIIYDSGIIPRLQITFLFITIFCFVKTKKNIFFYNNIEGCGGLLHQQHQTIISHFCVRLTITRSWTYSEVTQCNLCYITLIITCIFKFCILITFIVGNSLVH